MAQASDGAGTGSKTWINYLRKITKFLTEIEPGALEATFVSHCAIRYRQTLTESQTGTTKCEAHQVQRLQSVRMLAMGVLLMNGGENGERST
jgi:hypothetical protein